MHFEACTRLGFCDRNIARAIVPAYSRAQCPALAQKNRHVGRFARCPPSTAFRHGI